MSGLATSMPQLNVMFDDDDDQTGDSGMGTGSGSADYALCNQWTKLSGIIVVYRGQFICQPMHNIILIT